MATKKATEQASEQTEDILLNESNVWDVIEFARSMSGGMFGTGYLTPDLVSGKMKDINMNPMRATENMLDKALQNPKAYEEQLQSFSQDFELSSMVYKRLMAYLANMLSFDVTYTANVKKTEDYKSPKYKKDLETVEDFLFRFNYKKELRTVTKELIRNDAYFGCFVDAGDKYVLQELPPDFCKITGRWAGGFLFSFNMYWFMQSGVDINMYPSFFRRKYNELRGRNGKSGKYQPALPTNLREKSGWVHWVDIPTTFGVCFKFQSEISTRLPYFSPLFSDLILQSLMRNLQKNLNMAAASKMIMGEVPLLAKDIKATVKDSIAISPELLGKFMALVKNAITDAIKVASAPLNDIKAISFETDNQVYDQYLRTALASSGVNTNLIFSSDIKANSVETQLSLNVDEQMMTQLYEQFNDFMDYYINRATKTFRFSMRFEGTEFFLDKQARFDTQMELFDKGIVMPQKIAAAMGMSPAEFRKHMEQSAADDFMKMLTPPTIENERQSLVVNPEQNKTTAITPKSDTTQKATAGRPRKKDSEIGDEGEATRSKASNVGRGGKVR